MKKLQLITLFVLIAMVTACTSSNDVTSTSTRVTDMVQADVFEVLPQTSDEVLVYNNSDEIEGEYLELASVEIEEVGSEKSEDEIINRIKEEAKALGSNGVVVVTKTETTEDGSVKREIRAVAIYSLERAPGLQPAASANVYS